MPAAAPDVTVCIPAYQSAAFVAETLRSVQQQTHAVLAVNISVDLSDDGTAQVCHDFAAGDDRFRVFVQERRLGWIGNANFLLDRVDTEFFFFMPHDDTLAPTYVELLRAALGRSPDAVLAFAEREGSSAGAPEAGWTALAGPPAERLLAFLTAPSPGVPWQGLTRAALLGGGRRMRTAFDGFESHVLWLLELLCLGPFAHVAQPLYRKGPPRRGVSAAWAAWPQERKMAAAVDYGTRCLELVAAMPGLSGDGLSEDWLGADRYPLVLACAIRVLQQARLMRGLARVEPAGRHDDLVLLAGLVGRALSLGPLGEAEVAALRQSPGPRRMTAALLLRDAQRLKTLGIAGSAEAAQREAAALDPDGAAARAQPADADARHARRLEALETAEKALARSPTDAAALLELARLHVKARALEPALEAVRKVLHLDAALPEAHHLLAVVLRKQHRYEEAAAAARRALELDPRSPATQALLAKLQHRTHESNR